MMSMCGLFIIFYFPPFFWRYPKNNSMRSISHPSSECRYRARSFPSGMALLVLSEYEIGARQPFRGLQNSKPSQVVFRRFHICYNPPKHVSQDFLHSHLIDLDLNGICASAVDDAARNPGLSSKIQISAVLQVAPMSTSCCVHRHSTLISPFLYMDVH